MSDQLFDGPAEAALEGVLYPLFGGIWRVPSLITFSDARAAALSRTKHATGVVPFT
ncbi:hypothetical protein [Streptomyces sp. NPDC090057]|uniref:hypothetical protein n=1 Tax=Streptomyces sp. NPDC090057 TaxID=3365935 RepID=UPI003810E964